MSPSSKMYPGVASGYVIQDRRYLYSIGRHISDNDCKGNIDAPALLSVLGSTPVSSAHKDYKSATLGTRPRDINWLSNTVMKRRLLPRSLSVLFRSFVTIALHFLCGSCIGLFFFVFLLEQCISLPKVPNAE